jgi:hypothetical protein
LKIGPEEKKMKMFFDYAANAACPQRPAWHITPVDYKWAQVVFHGRNPNCICGGKKDLKPRQYWKVFKKTIVSLFRRCQITQIEEPTFDY